MATSFRSLVKVAYTYDTIYVFTKHRYTWEWRAGLGWVAAASGSVI
jgi:hypothetical protein